MTAVLNTTGRIKVRRTVHIGPMDPPLSLRTGDTLSETDFVLHPVTYGRVLFTSVVACEVIGTRVLVKNCGFYAPNASANWQREDTV